MLNSYSPLNLSMIHIFACLWWIGFNERECGCGPYLLFYFNLGSWGHVWHHENWWRIQFSFSLLFWLWISVLIWNLPLWIWQMQKTFQCCPLFFTYDSHFGELACAIMSLKGLCQSRLLFPLGLVLEWRFHYDSSMQGSLFMTIIFHCSSFSALQAYKCLVDSIKEG